MPTAARRAGPKRDFRSLAAAGLLLSAALWSPVYADVILLPEQTQAVAGGPVRVDLLVTNEDASETTFSVPERLVVQLSAGDQSVNMALARAAAAPAGTVQLPPGGMRRIAYTGTLPGELSGAVTLRAVDLTAKAAMMSLAPPAAPVAQLEDEPVRPETEIAPTPEGGVPLSREAAFSSALTAYEPVYFGWPLTGDSNAKFQLSLKFRFFNEKAGLAQRYRFLEDLYFGYTQTSIWDITASSSPFEDTSYKPRLFYSNPSSWTSNSLPLRLGIETGLGHESNGQGGADSRSINIAYARPSLVLGRPGDWQLTFAPMVYDYIEKEDNPDINQYRGYVDWFAAVGKADSWQLSTVSRWASQGWSVQVDLSYPMRSVALGNLNGYLFFQYFDGYGETILNYNVRSDPQYRLGIMFVR